MVVWLGIIIYIKTYSDAICEQQQQQKKVLQSKGILQKYNKINMGGMPMIVIFFVCLFVSNDKKRTNCPKQYFRLV